MIFFILLNMLYVKSKISKIIYLAQDLIFHFKVQFYWEAYVLLNYNEILTSM